MRYRFKNRLTHPWVSLLALVATTLGVVVAVQLPATPAHAAYSDCANGVLCLFDGPNGTGTLLFHEAHTPGTCRNVAASVNDRADSFYNRLNPSQRGGAHHVQFFADTNCTGRILYAEVFRTSGPFPFPSATQSNFIQEDARPRQVGCQFEPPKGCYRNLLTSIFYNSGFVGPTLSRDAHSTKHAAPMIPLRPTPPLGGTDVGSLAPAPVFAVVTGLRSYSQCPSGYVCLFEGTGGNGILGNGFYASPGSCLQLPYAYTDAADSFYNRLTNGHHVQFYDTANCSGAPGTLSRRQSNGSGGPHAVGVRDNFLSSFCCTDRDEVSGIFFNRG